MICMIEENVKIETIGMLKKNVQNSNNGLMLPFANLVFVANKISAQLEKEMIESKKSYSYYNTPTTNHYDEEDKKDLSSIDGDLPIDEKKLTISSIKSILFNYPTSGVEKKIKKNKKKRWVVTVCQSFIIILLLIFLLKSHLPQFFGSSDETDYEKNLILDEEEARQFIRNNGGQIEEKNFDKKFYSFPRQLKCYSCMSLNYQESWDYLQATYEKPHVFTNRCNDQHLMQSMGLVSCNTFCVTLAEPNVEAGVFIGFKYIRGCADKIVKNGFNQTALRTHRFISTPTCRMLPRALIFNQPKGMDVPVYGDVRLCTCFTDRCNAASNSASIFKKLPLSFKVWFIFLLLISFTVINCYFVL
ncbi:Caenorhabditis elegans ly-6-related family-containing protein [Strongyloides ratti]|uniref:Caenorhabditis elegans ly-6-related family-containing protein n=1 Tax=Strongyloides ratti TaxID=34506 RepID=A0A090LJ71_STRRB|nr:Caenorhabditis elegans ly-6-related family-containing protein [Strongyloides ratti]CEF69877.1 Caenorhabditis elegans ly-6-related family-containing protein [Strongyloides ratti]